MIVKKEKISFSPTDRNRTEKLSPVPADKYKTLCVHKDIDKQCYKISHILTGALVLTCRLKKEAVAACLALLKVYDFNFKTVEEFNIIMQEEALPLKEIQKIRAQYKA